MEKNKEMPALPLGWYAVPPASDAAIIQLARAAPVPLPQRYVAFMRVSNGGEGVLNGRYVSLWPVEEVITLNEAYGIFRYLARSLAIGTDGGDYAYLLDGRVDGPPLPVLEVELGSLGLAFDAAEPIAESFEALLGIP